MKRSPPPGKADAVVGMVHVFRMTFCVETFKKGFFCIGFEAGPIYYMSRFKR